MSFGTKLPTARLLPGIGIDVLGPPILRQSKAIAHQAPIDLDEYWHLAARRGTAGTSVSNARRARPIFPNAPTTDRKHAPQDARWVIPRIEKLNAEELLAIVRILDGALNNTSVILLFEIGETVFLFRGDAQIENWDWSLKLADDHQAIRKKLAKTRFYKVGHHGSLNATPKTLWNGFEHRGKAIPGRLVTMVSTLSNVHGSRARRTEVPRASLIEEFKQTSDFYDTRNLRKKIFWSDVELELRA